MKTSKVIALLYVASFLPSVFGGTVITNNLPANTAIINIDARLDGAASYNGDQSLWFHPFFSSPATQLVQYAIQPGTYSFRVINPADAAQMFPALPAAQTNQMFSAWTYNSPWIEDYLVFPSSAATNFSVPQIFDGAPDPASYVNPSGAYNGAVLSGYASVIRTGPAGRNSTTLTNSFTFATATNLIFVVPDNGLTDNSGGVSVLISPTTFSPMPVTKTWTGSANQDWFNANNWSPAGVPNTNDTIVLNSSGTINLTAPVTIAGIFNCYGGSLTGQPLMVATNGVLNLLSGNGKSIQMVVTNAGRVTWFDGDLPVYNYNGGPNGRIENLAGAVWDIECDHTFYNPYGDPASTFHNLGTVQKSAGGGTSIIRLPMVNEGVATVQTGTLNFEAGGTIQSVFTAAAGAVMHFHNGTFTYTNLPTLNGPGAIQFDGGFLTLLNDVIPNLQLVGGTLTLSTNFQQGGVITNLNHGGTLSGNYTNAGTVTIGNGVAGTLTVLNGATFNLNNGNVGGLVLNSGATLNWNNGTMQGPLDVVGGAVVNWSNGSANNVVNVRTNGSLNLLTSNSKTFYNMVTNAGTVTWFDGDLPVYNLPASYYGAVENLPGARWDIRCDRTIYNPYGNTTNAYFHNLGLLQKTNANGNTDFRLYLINESAVTALTGTISFNGGGNIQSVFNAAAGATIRFNGGTFTYGTLPTLNGPGAIQFSGGVLTLLNDVIPNLQLTGGTLVLSTNFQQGGVITNLNFGGQLSGNYTNAGTLTLGNGIAGTLTVLNGATLNWNNGTVNGLVLNGGATVNWNNGTMQGPLDIGAGVVVNWSNGSANNIVNVRTNGSLNLISSNGKTFYNMVTNAGTVTWFDGDLPVYNLAGNYYGAVENLPGGLWDIRCDRTLYNPYGGTNAYFDNLGTIQKTNATGNTDFRLYLNNVGVVTALTGTISFNGGGIIQSIFNAAAGAAIHFNGGTFTYNSIPVLNGPGAIQFTGGFIQLNDDLIPNLQMTGGSIGLSPSFQGGSITNLTLAGATLSGSYVVTGTFNCGNGVSGSLTVTNGGTVNWSNGNITGPLEIRAGAVVNWSNGSASGTVNIRTNGSLNLTSSATKTFYNAVTNAGAVIWFDGDLSVYNLPGNYYSLVENLPGGFWDIRCDRTMSNPYGNGLAYFNNRGTFLKSAGTSVTIIRVPFTNANTVTAQTGTISFDFGGTVESVYNAAAGALIRFQAGSFTYTNVPTLNGPGAINLTGGSLTLLNDVIPYLQMTGGTVYLSAPFQGGTITNLTLAGANLGGDHVVTGLFNCGNGVSGDLIATNGATVNWNGGTISGHLDIASGALVNWSNGTETSTTSIRTGGALNLLSSNTKAIQGALTNFGTVTWLDGDLQVYNLAGTYSGLIENLGGLWDIQCDRGVGNPYGNGLAVFHNVGTVQKSSGTGQTSISLPFNNAATLDIESGAIQFNNSGYAQTGATLRFGLNTASATQMRVNSANMAFDGTLSAGFVRGQTPHLGDVFTVITYSSHSGVWNHFNLPTLTNGLSWKVAYNSGNAQLQIVTNANTTAHITGVVTNAAGIGVSNVTVFAYTTNSSNGTYVSSVTDGTGHYSLAVSNATWNVGLQNLPALGYNQVPEQIVVVSGSDQTANFSLQPYSGQLYSITTAPNPPEAGATSGDGSFAPGAVVSVSAVANTNSLPYFFANWSENGVFQSANSSYSFLAARDRQLTANFTLPLYTITVSNNPSAAGVVVGSRTNYYAETNILTAQPNFGYKFSNWTENATVLSTSATLSTVIYSNHTFVANYAEANLFHDVSVVTSPFGITTVAGAAIYTNGQTGNFIAPRTVITSTNIYTFQNFTLSNNVLTASTNFSKTFATTDATNLQYVAVYSSMPVTPQIVAASANFQNPVPATTNLQLTFRFDRSMDTNFTPTVVVTNINNASPSAQPIVTGVGTWSTVSQANDTYVTRRITLATGMDGTNNVFISAARDLYGDVLPATNKLTLVVDATFPLISGVSVTPGAQSAVITWSTDEQTTAQADYSTNTSYSSSSPLYGQLVQLHSVTVTGLDPLTTYHFRVRSHDQAGNETASGDQMFTTLSAPDLQVQNLAATGTFNSGSNIVIAWDDANTGAGATYNSWYDLITVTNTDTHVSLLNTTLWYDASANGYITDGLSKHRQTTFHIPDGLAGVGNLLIAVTVNGYQSQFESAFNNNSQSITNLSSLSTYPDLQVVNLAVTNGVVQSGSVLGIQWKDTNSGNGPITGSFQDLITVSNSDTAQVLVNTTVGYDVNSAGAIAAGQAATRQYSFTLPNGTAGAGHLVITIAADSGNNIFENNGNGGAETNNTASINSLASLAAYADLAPTNIVAPTSASAGQTVQVSWTDLNLGNTTAVGPWSDQVFISDTPTLGNGQQIASFQINNVIAPSGSLNITQNVTLPAFITGNQWIIVKANAGNSFFENNTGNNSIVAIQPISVGATLALTLDHSTISESAGTNALTATVTRNGDTSSDLLVTVTNLGHTNITMPGNITIPAGQHGASFKVGIVDQHIAGGFGLETISASANGFPTANANLQIMYDDVAAVTVTVNTNQVSETAAPGVAFATVTRNANFGSALTVTVVSDLPTAMTVPSPIAIPAGQASATVNLTPVNDNTVGDTRIVHILASAPGYGTATATINVLNANSVQLSLVVADPSVAKGAPSPATIGTVTRTPVMSADQSIFLSVVGSSLISVPSIVTIPAGQASVNFNINVGDDNLATGPQNAIIIAQVLTPTRLIAPDGGTSTPFTILDTHGPTLSVSFADSVIAKGNSTTATVTRNTPATNSVIVNLNASPSDAVTLPPTVTIPQGQASKTFTISGVLDNIQTGARKIAVNAEATDFNSGTGNLTVSDVYYPDLAPTSVTVPSTATTEQQITVSWVVTNKGLAAATNHWLDYVYLSSDTLGQKANLATFKQNPTSLAVGASYTNTASFYLPNIPGAYWIIVTSDGGNLVSELNKQNNTFVSTSSFNSQPAYRAVLTNALPETATSGTPVVLSGYIYNPQDNSRVASKTATVRVLINGTRRVYSVTSDASGNFSYIFQPLANEAGDYTAGADYPLVSTDIPQVTFALLGMQSLPVTLAAQIIPNQPVTNYLVLSNVTDHTLTGLQITVPDLQGNLDAQFVVTNTSLLGYNTITVPYTVSSSLTRVAQIKFGAHVTSDQGAQLMIPAQVTVTPLTPQLQASPGYLQQGMLVGAQTFVSFDIVNTGGAETGDLTVQLPTTLPWMTLSSPGIIPSIQPGAKANVTLALNPPSNLDLTAYTGSIAVANNKTGVSVQFNFRATSDGKGDLRVTATDDYTYYVSGAPKVTNATVTVRDGITMAAVAQTNTDVNGIAYFVGLPEGPYIVDSSAPQHNPFRGSIKVVNGTTNDLEAFMTRQLVTYQWTVVPTEVQDEYKIQLESVFETEVPIPNVVVVEPQIMMFVAPGHTTQFDFKLRNEGLIAAQGVTIIPPNDPNYIITPLVRDVGTIPAKSEVSIPVTIQIRTAASSGVHSPKELGPECGVQPHPCLPKIELNAEYYYPCGGNNVVQQRSAQLALLCTGKDLADKILDCLKDLKELTGSENLAGVGCNAITAFLSCVGPDLDPCVLAGIATACGAATGGLAGAGAGAAGSLPACICAHLDLIPLPSFPTATQQYNGRPDFGLWPILPTGSYYVSGSPSITATTIGTCSGAPNIATPFGKTKSIVVGSMLAPKLKSPKISTGGVCARVRIRIDQSVVLTRTAFKGTLEVDNGGDHAITDIRVDLDFRDATNGVAADKFVTEGPVLSTMSAIDGTGSLNGGANGSAVWTFIPTVNAAPDAPETFQIGGTLSYTDNGEQVVVPLLSAPISVYPEARLDLDYFQQRDVYADDPFTPVVEPSEPFTLGLIVKNIGAGNAHNFKITSGQPQIVENEKGLLINFTIIGTQVGNQPLTPSLAAAIGDITPGGAKQVVWDMTSTLQGKFISFDATFQHINDLGATNTSLINSVQIHELIHKVLGNRSSQYDGTNIATVDDDLADFLVNEVPDPGNLPDVLYLSDGSTAPVNVQTNATVDGAAGAGHLQVHLSYNATNGWNYLQVPDPGPGFLLASVVRADGKPIALTNDAWTTDRTFPGSSTGAVREHLLHLFDWVTTAGTRSYTVTYRSTNTTPPAIVQVGPVTPFVQPGAVSSVNVTFSEQIDVNTFDYHALILTRNGSANLITSGTGVSIAPVSGNTYAINGLSGVTTADGNYQLTVNVSTIRDLWGNNGNTSASVEWAKGNAPLVVQTISSVTPNPRKTPVTSVSVTFSRAINAATFNYQALMLTLNGGANLITPDVTVALQSGSTFTINGLGPITGAEGTYVLTVNAAAVQDSSNNAGTGTKSVNWTTYLSGPRITALQQLTANPRNIVVPSLDVTFAHPIDPTTFDYHAISLTRDGGANLVTSDVTVTAVDSTTYRVGNINWVQGYAGNYSFSVNASGVFDLAGNPGAGSTNETWQIILNPPPSPTNLVIAPDTGASSADGLTRTNAIVLSGTVGATNLTIRVTDTTSGLDLGSALVTGTNFTMPLTFSAEGQHHLKVYSVDIAQNVSTSTFFDVFIDLVGPSAVLQSVSPNPITTPVTNLLVTFSEDINTNTMAAATVTLTRNGTPVGTPTILSTSSKTAVVSGIAAVTGTPATYQLTVNLTAVQDLAGNFGRSTLSTTWQNVPPNQAPIFTQETNVTVQAGLPFQKQIDAFDPDGDDFTFALGSSAPLGAQLTTNGLFTWTPTCDQGGTSNLITIFATDNGNPVASSSMSFAIVVSDCLQIQISSAITQVGKTGTLPVTVFSSTGVTNLSFVLTYPTNRLDTWSIAVSNSAVASASMTRLDGARTLLQVSAGNGQSLQGSTLLGTFSFSALSGPSAFLSVKITNASALKSGNNPLSSVLANSNRVVVIGAEPLLESQNANNGAQVTLYGNPGASYGIDSTADFLTWKLAARIPMTNLSQTLPLHPLGPLTFYRAFEFSADPPVLDLNLSAPIPMVVLYGRNNTNYTVDFATNLVHPSWQNIGTFPMTNSFWFKNLNAITNHQMFFRAKRP